MDKNKTQIFLAGDSTMQAYKEEQRPQFGWGEVLYKYINSEFIKCYHRDSSLFDQQKTFETEKFLIDDCAMAGRSLRSFTNEKRHIDIFNNINKNDYLILQFGHNDVSVDKEERYVPIEELEFYFDIFINESKEKGLNVVILSPILIDIYTNENETLKEMVETLKKYVVEIERIAKENALHYIHVGSIAKNYFNGDYTGIEDLYLEDHVHLNEKGADFYAEIVAKEISSIL